MKSRTEGLTRLAMIPLACTALNYLIHHFRRTTFWWEREEDNKKRKSRSRTRCSCGFDPLARWPMVLATLTLVRAASQKALNEGLSGHIAKYLNDLTVVICLGVYYWLLELINRIVDGMIQEQEAINKTGPVSKMQSLVANITRTKKPDKDIVYCFAQTNTVPGKVLSYIWWVYYIVGKAMGAVIAIGVLAGLSESTVGHMLVGGLALSAATASGFAFEIGPNTLNLFRLSLNKPFYVGDLVTLNRTGAMDDSESIMGFVENITMMYVVIRNFEMKQTWIPHSVFSGLVIQNWTRRPSKTVLLNIGISSRCPAAKVEQLTKFGMSWIGASEEIQQANYRKCHITKVAQGYNIEVIFFPEIGVSHRGIRQKFLIAFMKAAERMGIPFVPLAINQNFCDEAATASHPADRDSSSLVTSEMCQDLLPDPNDKLPKGVGLGFKKFPENQPDLENSMLSPKRSFHVAGTGENEPPDLVLPFTV